MGILDKPLPSNNFLKGEDLDAGVTVKLVSAEAITLPEDKEKFAVNKDSKLVKEGVLKEGQTMRYTFSRKIDLMDEWEDVVFENSSTGFYGALSSINPEAGQAFTIKRTGQGTETRYLMKLMEDEATSGE